LEIPTAMSKNAQHETARPLPRLHRAIDTRPRSILFDVVSGSVDAKGMAGAPIEVRLG
jgi:hypothetical protein